MLNTDVSAIFISKQDAPHIAISHLDDTQKHTPNEYERKKRFSVDRVIRSRIGTRVRDECCS